MSESKEEFAKRLSAAAISGQSLSDLLEMIFVREGGKERGHALFWLPRVFDFKFRVYQDVLACDAFSDPGSVALKEAEAKFEEHLNGWRSRNRGLTQA